MAIVKHFATKRRMDWERKEGLESKRENQLMRLVLGGLQ